MRFLHMVHHYQQKKNRLPLLTDSHDNTKDPQGMKESWCPCTYIPCISFGQHKQTNLPSANSPLDMLMLALNRYVCVHGQTFFLSNNFLYDYSSRYSCHREVAPFGTFYNKMQGNDPG